MTNILKSRSEFKNMRCKIKIKSLKQPMKLKKKSEKREERKEARKLKNRSKIKTMNF